VGRIEADHSRLAQLFGNLLANAIAHGTADQAVRVRSVIADDCLTLSVTNSGTPIPAEAIDHLFQPFYRANAGSVVEGLGLGLYISSQIAEAHSGGVTVSSDTIETRFTFRMPLARSLATQDH
jgi:sigma-B regulation protein RsbU (phosphoserine phosphatase)